MPTLFLISYDFVHITHYSEIDFDHEIYNFHTDVKYVYVILN